MLLFKNKSQRAPAVGDVHADDDRGIEVRRPQDESRRHFWAEARLLFRDLAFALMIASPVIVFVVQPVKVEGTSMLPRLEDGERIFVNKLIYYGLTALVRGDIIVCWYAEDSTKSSVRRLLGLPGESVQVTDGRILCNGMELGEPYLDPERNVTTQSLPPVLVKPHYYFVMGDNRNNPSDSR